MLRFAPLSLGLLLLLPDPATSGESSPRFDGPHPVRQSYDCRTQNQIPRTECEALVALHRATNGPGWTNANGWLSSPTPCSWFGVTCNSGSVSRVELEGNLLSGSIPTRIGDLTNLRYLNLSQNQLTGFIPPELGNLSRLVNLYLSSNQLAGRIPPQLGRLSRIQNFYLLNNRLSGPIPPELGNLPEVRRIRFEDNDLSGPIPFELGRLSTLNLIRLQNNNLSGVVPIEVVQLGGRIQSEFGTGECILGSPGNDNLSLLDIQAYRDADLDGDGKVCSLAPVPLCSSQAEIPQEECQALVAVYEATNGPAWTNSTGWLSTLTPCSWFGVTCTNGHVASLLLVENHLSGSIPDQIGDLPELTNLRLHRNDLSGVISPSLGNLTKLRGLYLGYNGLTGPLPAELSALKDIRTLSFNANDLSGSLPTYLGEFPLMSTMALQGNEFTGSIPPELANAAAVQRFHLHDNNLSGPIPAGFGALGALRLFTVHNNNLTGPIPADLGQATTLTQLSLFRNELSGEIPEVLGQLTALTFLRLDDNSLEGLVPLGVAQVCAGAETCNLANNPGLVVPGTADFAALATDGLVGGLALQAPTEEEMQTVAEEILTNGLALIHLEGVQGESQDPNNPEWSEVHAFSWGADRAADGFSSLGSAAAGFLGLTIKKPVDSATPSLLQLCAEGRATPRATMKIAERPNAHRVVLELDMDEVFIGSSELGEFINGRPFETVTIFFRQGTWTYNLVDEAGNPAGSFQMSWNEGVRRN